MTQATASSPVARADVEVLAKDLNENGGIFCPSPLAGMQLWNGHPRVFLDVAQTGSARCPYCGTVYRLRAGEVFKGH
ncbi:zinc-finger domain-containing protein [Lampropedia cohaerens]|uniref:zinc-finger domain-containing protein n=1 Tax=Lampropedia cohaerens TaxID=1610491 RepID=UPI000A07D23C